MWRRMFRGLLWLGVLLWALSLTAVGLLVYRFAPELERYDQAVRNVKQNAPGTPGRMFHSRLYSSSFFFTPGSLCDRDTVIAQLDAREYQATDVQELKPGQYRIIKSGLEVFLRGYQLPGSSGPAGQIRLIFQKKRLAGLIPLEGTVAFQTFSIEPILLAELLGEPPRRASFAPLARIPAQVIDAVIASEDSRFRSHYGVDLRGILRAATRNLEAGDVVEGGSTITQQLTRMLFLTRARTVERKISEAAIALVLDRHLSKDEQLELYLNAIYLGQQDGIAIHGVAEAARAFFDKPVESLDLAQAATLASIIPAPNAYSPLRNPERTLERRNRVLDLMLEQGKATGEMTRQAREEPLAILEHKTIPMKYGYYSGYVRNRLATILGPDYELKGLTIHSELDPVLQNRVEASLLREIVSLEQHFGKRKDPLQGAAFLMNHQSGRVLAIVGGRGYASNPYNRAFQALRQPGSAFKGIVYTAALDDDNHSFTPCTTVPNARRTFQVKEGDWRPRNYEHQYQTSTTLAKALVKSLNVATINLVDMIGPECVAETGQKLGISNLRPVLSIGLGTSEVTLERLTAAYASFPAEGFLVDPMPVDKVMDIDNNLLYKSGAPSNRVIKSTTAALMVEILRDVVIYGTAWRLRAEGYFTAPSAGKTGTTQDEQDAWYIGFNPDYILGVWFGYDTPQHMNGSASDIAVPAWGRLMTDIMDGRVHKDFTLPNELEYVWIDPYSGGLSSSRCPQSMRVAVLKGTGPTRPCQLEHDEPAPQEQDDESGDVASPPDTTAPTP